MQISDDNGRPGVAEPTDNTANQEIAFVDDGHAHHWKIAPQGAAHSTGRCSCGAERDFANSYSRDLHAYRPRS